MAGRPPIAKTAMTGAERQRRYWLKHRPDKPAPKPGADNAAAMITTLQKELAAAKARILDLEDENAAARRRLAHERKQHAVARPKADNTPLPPDEVFERQIKSLKTRVRNLMSERDAAFHLAEGVIAAGGMPRETRIAIDKALQPDQRANATKAENDEACDKACRLWNAWKNSNDKARRKVR